MVIASVLHFHAIMIERNVLKQLWFWENSKARTSNSNVIDVIIYGLSLKFHNENVVIYDFIM